MKKSIVFVTRLGNGRVVIKERPILTTEHKNRIILDPESERERQRIKSIVSNITQAVGSIDNINYLFTFSDEILRHKPLEFLKCVSEYLKRQGVNFVGVIEIYHTSHYGDWILDNSKSSWEYKDGSTWEYRGAETSEPDLDSLDNDYGVHIHGLADKNIDFSDWEKEHPSSNPQNLYCEEIYSYKYNEVTQELEKDIEKCIWYITKNIKYTKRYFHYIGLDKYENGNHRNIQIYKCNARRIKKDNDIYQKNEDGSLILLSSTHSNISNIQREILRSENDLNNLLHNNRQRELEEVFSSVPYEDIDSSIDNINNSSVSTKNIPIFNHNIAYLSSFNIPIFYYLYKTTTFSRNILRRKYLFNNKYINYNHFYINKSNTKQYDCLIPSFYYDNWLLKYIIYIKNIPKNAR